MLGRLRRVHFVGIGGSGMSGIALLLQNLGFEVSGSDLAESEMTRRLIAAGARVAIGHSADNCSGADVVVFSSAVPAANPELECAQQRGVPVIRRAEMLAELMRMKFAIAVSGSHGKTTVTSIVGHLLERGGLDPTTVIGGRVLGTETGARLGRSEYLVAEADESDRSFLLLHPTIAVVTNIEPEHLDIYKNLSDLRRTFVRFLNRVPFYGSVVLCTDSPAARSIRSRVKRRVVTYGIESPADLQAKDIQLYGLTSAFSVVHQGTPVGRFSLRMAGIHNVANALAALAVGSELGLDFRTMEQALAIFAGVHRRIELLGEKGGVEVFDDYGHHPTEIRATIEALRQAYPKRRIVVLFQPHRFTRTRALAEDFGSAFDLADLVIVTAIYPASEEPIPGVSEQLITDAISRLGRTGLDVRRLGQLAEAMAAVVEQARPGDLILTLGAGSICRTGEQILSAL